MFYILMIGLLLLGMGLFAFAFVDESDNLNFGCITVIAGIIFIVFAFCFGSPLNYLYEAERKEAAQWFEKGYKRGQIECIKGSIIYKKLLNQDGEAIFQKTGQIPLRENNLRNVNDSDLANHVDSVFEAGFRRGQIDCINGTIKYEKVMNDDGEVIYQKK